MTNEIFKTGSLPGKGRYICTKCKGDVNLDDDTDRLPPCACKGVEFTREDKPIKGLKEVMVEETLLQPIPKMKRQKDMIKIMAEEGGRFASNRGGSHTELILDKGENIITKAQFEICKDAPGIKKL